MLTCLSGLGRARHKPLYLTQNYNPEHPIKFTTENTNEFNVDALLCKVNIDVVNEVVEECVPKLWGVQVGRVPSFR